MNKTVLPTLRRICGISLVNRLAVAATCLLVFSCNAAQAEEFRAPGWDSPSSAGSSTAVSDASDIPPSPTLRPYVKMTPEPQAATDVVAPAVKPDVERPNSPIKSTVTRSKSTQTDRPAHTEDMDKAVDSIVESDLERMRRDGKTARKLARVHWLDKVAAANPRVIEAIANDKKAASILAQHPRLGAIADSDHYVCRRLTRWKSVARLLAENGQACHVILLDPAGFYEAVKRDRGIVRILSRNPLFDQMIVDNPDFGRILAQYM